MPHSYQLLSGAAWWQRYHASNCPEGPGSEYFTVLLWHRDTVQNAPQWVMEMPFRNSIMGAPRRPAFHCRLPCLHADAQQAHRCV